MEKSVTVTIPASAHKGFGRDAGWTVAVVDGSMVVGVGSSLAQARMNAATTAVDVIRTAMDGPAFALDDDGGLVVAVPWGTGSIHYKVRDGHVFMITSTVHAPHESLTGCHHYTPLPNAC